jgi:hypothetical protein
MHFKHHQIIEQLLLTGESDEKYLLILVAAQITNHDEQSHLKVSKVHIPTFE